MLKWALIFAVIAIVSGALGFTEMASGFAAIAKVIFFIFLALFLIALIAGLVLARKITGKFS